MKTIRLTGLFVITTLLFFSCTSTEYEAAKRLGFEIDSLKAAKEGLQSYIDDGKLAGISALVMKDGEVVYRSLHGYASLEKEEPLKADQLFRIYSMSKPVTTVALMTLYEEGKFELDDPISDYLPEYDQLKVYAYESDPPVFDPINRQITFRHLLTHTAGFTYGWDPYYYVDSLYQAMVPPLWQAQSLEEFSNRLVTLPLKFQPGVRFEYSVSIDIAGYLVERISGIPLDKFMQERIFDKLGMEDTRFWVPEEDHSRLATIYLTDYTDNTLKPGYEYTSSVMTPVSLFSGGGGLVSTIEDYARFAQMLLLKGELDGVRILKEETANLIMSDQLPEGVVYTEREGYGLGGSVNLETGTYAWGGMASTAFWVEPEKHMVILCFAQYIPNQKYPFDREFRARVLGGIEE